MVNIIHLINVITAHKPSPLAKQVKCATKQKHDIIENHPLMIKLTKGRITDLEYAVYLKNLLPIYRAVEHTFFDVNTSGDLIRSKNIEQDLSNYEKTININDKRFNNLYDEWLTYFYSKDFFLKKTELYIRWLADLYGGQIIKNNVKFNSKYNFKNVRKLIKIVRTLIEDELTESNVESFIEHVNKSYDMHYVVVDRVYDATN